MQVLHRGSGEGIYTVLFFRLPQMAARGRKSTPGTRKTPHRSPCGSFLCVCFEFAQKTEDLALVVESVLAVGHLFFGAQDRMIAEVCGDGEGAFEREPAHQTAAEGGGEHVARAVEGTFHVRDRHAALSFVVFIIDVIAVLCLRARDHGVGAYFGEHLERRGEVLRPGKQVALRLVGKDIIRLAAKREHLVGERLIESLVEREIVAENGVNDEHAVFFEKAALDVFYKGDLRAAAEIPAVNEIVFEMQAFPVIGDLLHFVVKPQESISRKSARMGGKEGGGENVAGHAACRDNGQRNGEGAFPDA